VVGCATVRLSSSEEVQVAACRDRGDTYACSEVALPLYESEDPERSALGEALLKIECSVDYVSCYSAGEEIAYKAKPGADSLLSELHQIGCNEKNAEICNAAFSNNFELYKDVIRQRANAVVLANKHEEEEAAKAAWRRDHPPPPLPPPPPSLPPLEERSRAARSQCEQTKEELACDKAAYFVAGHDPDAVEEYDAFDRFTANRKYPGCIEFYQRLYDEKVVPGHMTIRDSCHQANLSSFNTQGLTIRMPPPFTNVPIYECHGYDSTTTRNGIYQDSVTGNIHDGEHEVHSEGTACPFKEEEFNKSIQSFNGLIVKACLKQKVQIKANGKPPKTPFDRLPWQARPSTTRAGTGRTLRAS
jgi:hypothetical protein